MKFSNLNGKKLITVGAFIASLTIASCNNQSESEKNSTTTTTDTGTTGMTDMDKTMPSTDTTTVRTNRTTRKGKVTVSMITTETKSSKMTKDKAGYYNYAEVPPVYKGGQSAVEDYISNHIEYPQDAIDNNIEGTVKVQFGIDENGKISEAKVISTRIGYGLEEEALKVVANMPAWTPGQVKGQNIKTRMVLPITYRIEG